MGLGFADSIRATLAKQLAEVDSTIEGMAEELFTAVVDFSPNQIMGAQYAKGEFINNWQAVVNGESNVTISARSQTGDASRESIRRLKGMKTFFRKDGFVTLSNSTSYADLVEYKGWPSSINPRWTNNVGPYAPVRNAWNQVIPRFKV